MRNSYRSMRGPVSAGLLSASAGLSRLTPLLTVSFGGREIVGLRQNCDRTLFVTYSVPSQDPTDPNVVHVETRVMRVDLQ